VQISIDGDGGKEFNHAHYIKEHEKRLTCILLFVTVGVMRVVKRFAPSIQLTIALAGQK
jgi:hypothetical protein